MHARTTVSARAMLLAAILAVIGSACEDSTSPDRVTIVGTWSATSFGALGTDFIADGMSLTATFTSSGNYTLQVEDDMFGACEPGPDCTIAGTYTSTSSQVTLDPDTEDELSFAYGINGSTMTWIGAIEGVPVTATFTRQ